MFSFYQQLMRHIDIFQLQDSTNTITLKSNYNFWNRHFFEWVYGVLRNYIRDHSRNKNVDSHLMESVIYDVMIEMWNFTLKSYNICTFPVFKLTNFECTRNFIIFQYFSFIFPIIIKFISHKLPYQSNFDFCVHKHFDEIWKLDCLCLRLCLIRNGRKVI